MVGAVDKVLQVLLRRLELILCHLGLEIPVGLLYGTLRTAVLRERVHVTYAQAGQVIVQLLGREDGAVVGLDDAYRRLVGLGVGCYGIY